MNEALGWNLWFAILFILMMTALITLTGKPIIETLFLRFIIY